MGEKVGNSTVDPDDTINTEKSALRTQIRSRRNALAESAERARRDHALSTYLFSELDRRDPHHVSGVAAYCPQHGEPGGPDLPERIADTGRPVWVPIVTSRGQPLRWLQWRGVRHTRPGAFGILEPVPSHDEHSLTTADLLPQVTTLIIPALAINSSGERLGQGGGFYDRSLADSTATSKYHGKILAIVDHNEYGVSVPATELDITVPVVVTDTGIFRPNPHEAS